jgi:hypothetical protein
MRNRFRRWGLLASLTVAGAVAPASAAVADTFFVEATGTGAPLVNNQMVVVFQCGAINPLLLGSHLTDCYTVDRGTGLTTHAQIRQTQTLWQGIMFMQADARYSLCAGGYHVHPLGGARVDIPTQCTVSANRQAHLLLFGPP